MVYLLDNLYNCDDIILNILQIIYLYLPLYLYYTIKNKMYVTYRYLALDTRQYSIVTVPIYNCCLDSLL